MATAPESTSTASDRPSSAAAGPSFIDPSSLMKIKNLQMRAKVIVEGFMAGLHRSPYHGFSVEFTDYRQYSPGDDPKYVDWRLFARSDRYFIKKFEDETNRRCYLLVDLSSGFLPRSSPPSSSAGGARGCSSGRIAFAGAADRKLVVPMRAAHFVLLRPQLLRL